MHSFSIPCESWGSATRPVSQLRNLSSKTFQYSLRIVGFRDNSADRCRFAEHSLSVFPANRGVPRRRRPNIPRISSQTFSIPCESWGSATIPNTIYMHIPNSAFSIPCESWGSATASITGRPRSRIVFQYSLRIVGFRDSPAMEANASVSTLSVFPANRGVPRLRKEEMGPDNLNGFQYSLRIVGFCDQG